MATRTEIVECLERLETHCRAPLMAVDARTGWMMDWCEDLKEFDAADIQQACAKWRNGDERKFPLPGQLKAVIRSLRPVASVSESAGGPWREISDAEYRGLSIRDKIRHHLIASQDCLRRAGPMWASGKPLALEEMPARWHTLKAEAREHTDSARRLQEKLSEYQGAA